MPYFDFFDEEYTDCSMEDIPYESIKNTRVRKWSEWDMIYTPATSDDWLDTFLWIQKLGDNNGTSK